MAGQISTIRLSRYDAQPWGFRLQGGMDFGTPLVVQKVNGGSLSEQAGILAGDALLKVNNVDVYNMRHKDAQDLIVRSGNNFDVTIQRGGSVWRPQVTPTGSLPSPTQHANHMSPVTKTSLAHKQQEVHHIGSGHNNAARPFSSVNGGDGQVKSIVNKQYNTPVGIYSEEAIAETLSAQAEVLAGGVLGVNFKKNEKIYNSANSEVLKMLHEQENDKEPDYQEHTELFINSPAENQQRPPSPATKHVIAPIDRPKAPNTGGLPTGQNICSECERLIVGVFVRIKDKNLHAECFKCATCGTNLKNQGYYNFNNKLYCDIHARLAAMNNPPKGTEGYSPLPIKPNAQLSASTISAALNTHSQHNGSNHESVFNVMSSVSPSLSHTHSRTSSLSSSSLNSLAGISSSSQSSAMSRLSPDKLMSSPEKLSPAHSRQSSESGSTNVFGHHPTSFHQIPSSGSVGTIRTNSRTMSPVMSFPPPPPPPPLPFDKTMSPSATITHSNEITINHRPKDIQDVQITGNGVSSSENGVGRPTNGGISNGGGGCDSDTVSGGDFVESDGGQQHVLSQSNVYNKFLKKYANKMQNDFLDGPATNGSGHKSYSATTTTSCGTTNPTSVTTDRINDSCENSGSVRMASTVTAPFMSKTNGHAENGESIYGTIRPHKGGRKDSMDEFKYVTLDGSVIRSVIPPGKGVRTNYKINTGYGGPKPFNTSPMSPPMRGPQSPSTYPPPTNVQSWDQPKPQPKPQVNPYATLPRATGQSQEESRQQQCFMYQQQQAYEQQQTEFKKERSVFEEDIEIIEANKHQTGHFAWPPARDENRCTPTATPLYIAPPETLHVIPKPLVEKPPEQQSQWQSRSAPELTTSAAAQQKATVEIESSSDSYTSTSTTTTTTSEEYQRMYQAQAQAYQMQQTYEQYGSENDYHVDMEVAAMQYDQSSSGYFDSSQSGRRSAQECVDYIAGPVSTYHLIDLVRAATPKPETPPPKPQRKVEFSDDVQIQHTAQVTCEETQKAPAIEKEPPPVEKCQQSVVKQANEQLDSEDVQVDEHEDELKIVHTPVTAENRKFTATPEIKIDIPEVKPIPPSKIPNPTPKEWISPMVKALTTAPDKPIEMAESVTSECMKMFESVHFHEETPSKTQEVSESVQQPTESKVLEEEPLKGSFLSNTMTTAPTDPIMFAPKMDDPIPLPQESEPYMPPPMDMKPYLREDYRPKSPFLSALTIAPDRSYTPYGHDVCSQLLDLPTPKEKLTMTAALTVASSRCYTPLDPTNASAVVEAEKKKASTYQFFSDVSESSCTQNIDSEINRQISAFTNVKGSCDSCPFQPRNESLNSNATITVQSSRQNSLIPQAQSLASERRDSQHHQSQDRKQSMFQSMSCAASACTATTCNCMNQTSCSQSSTTCKKEKHQQQHKTATTANRHQQQSQQQKTEQESEQKISFPPPLGPMAKKTLHSGLHKPDSIPQYQRNWTVLPSQRPVRTPEPPELKENVPLAFVETPTPRELTPSVESTVPAKSCAASTMASSMSQQQQHVAATLTETKVSNYHHQQQQYQQQQSAKQEFYKSTLPIIVTENDTPVTMAFQSLDINHDESHSRPYTPSSLINRPAPIIPYYQTPANLVAEECSATQARLYDPRSPSPYPDRAHSPAPGPPPNPLNSIRAPRLKELSSEVALSYRPPIQTGSITTGQSYYGTQQAQFQTVEHGHLVSHQQQGYQAGAQTFVDKPEIVQQRQIGDTTIQTKAKESRMNEENRSATETKSTTQVGNMQIERRRKVVEEYEHSQTAKSVEIRTNHGEDSKQTVQYHQTGRTGFVANQARRLSNLEQEISSVSSQSQAIAARAAHLGNINLHPLPNLTPIIDEIKEKVGTIDSLDLPPPPPPLPGAMNGNSSPMHTIPARSANQSSVKPLNNGSAINNRTARPFQPGLATEMLTNSLEKVEINDKEKFRDEAGKIISAMLESRLAQKTNANLTKEFDSNHPMKKIIDVCDNSQILLVDEPVVDTNMNQTSGLILEVSTDGKILSGSPTEHGPSECVVYRNKSTNPKSKRELSTHAFDRRSYIETNSNSNQDPVKPVVNGNLDNTTTLVSDLKDGKEPVCCQCNTKITRGPFITALGRIWCPDHFVCVNGNCRRPLQDIGFVEEKGDLYCEFCFEKFLAPTCSKCSTKIKGDCLNAIGKHYHPECFSCSYCNKHFGNSPFFLEEGEAYCEADWNELFTTKCFACGFPVEAGDRWVEALNHNYHSQCFNCTMCKKNLEGQSFYNKGGRPFCKNHAR